MPGNAGFLYAGMYHDPQRSTGLFRMLTKAVAYMAAGWQGSEGHAPGFPNDGTWVVKHEGLHKAL